MATRKMTKQNPAENVEVQEQPTSNAISVDADELVKSILSNVNAKNNDASHSKEYIMCNKWWT